MVDSITIRPGVVVPSEALTFQAVRASGPGGQNVNKVSSKVDLRVALNLVQGLDHGARERLLTACRGSLDADGRLIVVSQRTRDQRRNLEDAVEKVRSLVAQALVKPRARRPTRPSRGSVERRLSDKKRRSDAKSSRRSEE